MDATSDRTDHFFRQACFCGNLTAALEWHSKGAGPSTPDVIGYTPLLLALKAGHVHVAQWLLSVGASVNTDSSGHDSVLHAATKLNDPDILQSIVDAGADVHLQLSGERTALHTAASVHAGKCISVLLRAGLSLDAKDESDIRPLHLAAMNNGDGAQSFIAAALAQGASVDARDKAGRTALHHACMQNSRPICEVLLSHGADINAVDASNMRPLDLAIELDIDLYLRARGGISRRRPQPPTVKERIRASALSGQVEILLTLMQGDGENPSVQEIQDVIDTAQSFGHDNVIAAMQALQVRQQIQTLRFKSSAVGSPCK